MSSSPNIVDWLTLAAAVSGTLLTGFLSIWTIRRKEREVFEAHIGWDWLGCGPIAELPFVYIHNRSEHLLSVIEVEWKSRSVMFWFRNPGTALFYEEPGDLSFPYEVKAGETVKLYLNPDGAEAAFEKSKKLSAALSILRLPVFFLSIKTLRGSEKYIRAENAIPWSSRPSWMTGEKQKELTSE